MIEINNRTRSKIDLKSVRMLAEQVLLLYKKHNFEVSIGFVGDVVMRRLNKQYRGADRPTDVLSFEGEGNELGEVLIDYLQIKRQASKFGNTTKKELDFILVHGLLHLLGHEDNTDKKRLAMIKLGEEIIKKIKYKS